MLIGVIVSTCALAMIGFRIYSLFSAQNAMRRFWENQDMEEHLLDPLIVSGEWVVDTVLNEVRKPDMFRRHYAIIFLGNGRYSRAIDVLEMIARSPQEEEFRWSALCALNMIDRSRASLIFSEIQGTNSISGHGPEIDEYPRRTFWSALLNQIL